MKDPLQIEPTAYEILGVDDGATAADVEKAFKAGLLRGNVQRLTSARRTLGDPVERALIDLCQYDDAVLARLTPNPAADPDCLAAERRDRTLRDWERALAKAFPDPGIAHAMAVLSYYSAIDCELRKDHFARTQQAWRCSVACWGAVLGDRTAVLPEGEVRTSVVRLFIDRLQHRLADASQARRDRGEDVAGYAELERGVAAEVRVAQDLARVGIRVSGRTVVAGPLLLKQVRALDSVRKVLAEAAEKPGAAARLGPLIAALSPWAAIEELLNTGRPSEALALVAKLGPKDVSSEERESFERRGRVALAKQDLSVGKFDVALAHFAHALSIIDDSAERDRVCGEISAACQSRAAALQGNDLDGAIVVLERGLDLALGDKKLKATLAELLTQRAVRLAIQAQKQNEKDGDNDDLLRAMATAETDLERAAQLGSERAKENLAAVRNVVEDIKSGMWGLPAEVSKNLQASHEAAAAGQHTTAIAAAKRAYAAATGQAKTAVGKVLARALNTGAVDALNAITDKVIAIDAPDVGTAVGMLLQGPGRKGGGGKVGTFLRENWYAALVILLFIFAAALTQSADKGTKEFGQGLGSLCLFLWFGGPMIAAGFEWVSKTLSSTSNFGQSGATCEVRRCDSDARYVIRPPGAGQVRLCETHSNQLEELMRPMRMLDRPSFSRIVQAVKHLEEAVNLSPDDSTVRQNLEAARQMAKTITPIGS